jgi:hypothetical protein
MSLKKHTSIKGAGKMKKGLLILITALMVVLLFVSISAVLAQPNAHGAIECVTDIAYDGDHWSGTVAECSLAGDLADGAVPGEYFESGKTLHFSETFTIWPDSGGEIHGKDRGVWNFSTLKFRANGWVTDASEDWAHLVGYKFHEMGTTSNPDVIPITAADTLMRLAPAKPHR